MHEGHDPRVIVNSMISIGRDLNIPLYNVSIQKLLYFAHATYLVQQGLPLIRGNFEAWEFGPVCRPIYHQLKKYGRNEITEKIERFDLFTGQTTTLPSLKDQSALNHLSKIMITIGRMTPNQLISLSHVKGGAWHIVWNKGQNGATVGNIIADELTLQTISKLKITLAPNNHSEGLDEATPFT